MSTRVEPRLTLSDLDAMPDDGNRYEIIDGELLMSRSPSLIHQTVSTNLVFSIKSYLVRNPIGEVWTTPGVILSEFSAVIPDLAFVVTARLAEIASGERIIGAPDLIVEIISPGPENFRRDRIAKRQLYGRHGVREYWVVDPSLKSLELYVLKEQMLQLDTFFQDRDEITSFVLAGFRCPVHDFFGASIK